MRSPHAKNSYRLSVIAAVVLFAALNSVAWADENTPTLSSPDIQQKSTQLQQAAAQTIQDVQNQSANEVSNAVKPPDTVKYSIYPINTTLLTPACLVNDTITLEQLTQPIFLIGADDHSAKWLQQHLTQLQNIHATGFLVQANNSDEAAHINALATGLPIIPVSGDSFAKQWNIQHYPILLLPTHS